MFAGLTLPVITSLVMLYLLPRTKAEEAPLLVGYYLLAFLSGGNSLIASWIVANTDGDTKKSINMCLYNAGASAGNIVGPLLFTASQAPAYHQGQRSVLGVFVALFCVIGIQLALLIYLNKTQEQKRVAEGKLAKFNEHSMQDRYEDITADNETRGEVKLREEAFADLTDRQNSEFIYVY